MIYKQVLFLLCCVAFSAGDRFKAECGLEAAYSQLLVRGGTEVKSKQFPWHVAIFHKEDNQFVQVCGGSLVRSQLVITAAHCFSLQSHNHRINVADYRVVGGILLSSWNSTEIGRQQSEVCTVRLGEEYGGSVRYYQDDIAIVQLMTTFTFSDTVRTVCLDLVDRELRTRQTSLGSVGKVAGWGLTESGTPSDTLNFLTVPVMEAEECIQKLPSSFKSFFTSDKICAGHSNGSAVCQGDSGGGLVFSLQNTSTSQPRWYLRALLSNAPTSHDVHNPCLANGFALYTNVSRHQIFISRSLENLQGAVCSARGSVGICQNSTDHSKETALGILPESYSPTKSDVCCVEPTCPSTVSQRKTGSKANEYCVDLTEKLFSCQQNGSSWSRGDSCGSELDKRRPGIWLAQLAKTECSKVQRYAMGQDISTAWSMRVFPVSERWLLAKASDWDYMLMYPGRDLTSTPEVIFTIAKAVFHPQYRTKNDTTTDNIVLLKINKPMSFSRSLRPVCLHTGDPPLRDYAGDLVITGFNIFDSSWHQFPADLLPREECARLFPPNTINYPDGMTDRHMCVTSRPSCAASYWYLTACDGHRVACTQLLVGLLLDYKAEDNSCERLILRVAPYVPWVESVVWP